MKPLFSYIVVESLSELYHFTNVGNMVNICNDDEFVCSSVDVPGGKDIGYYLSTTRMRTALTGYSRGMIDDHIVRIVLDGNKLSNKFKIKPVDWAKGKGLAIKANWPDPKSFDDIHDYIMQQSNVEAEDRVYTNTKVLKDFHKYIKAIHIDSDKTDIDEFYDIYQYGKKYNIEVVIMDHKHFMLGR